MNIKIFVLKTFAVFLVILGAYLLYQRSVSKLPSRFENDPVVITNNAILSLDPTNINYNAALSNAYENLNKLAQETKDEEEKRRIINLIKEHQTFDQRVQTLINYFPEIDLSKSLKPDDLNSRIDNAINGIKSSKDRFPELDEEFNKAINAFIRYKETKDNSDFTELKNTYNSLKIALIGQKKHIFESEGL